MRAGALACLMSTFAAGAPPVAAEGPWPAGPVRMLVPYPSGGGTDITARIVAQRLSETWGQPVAVDNRGGANGIIGTDAGAKAKPDGHTLIVVIDSHTSNAALYRNLPYDTAKDFAPIMLMARYPYILTTTLALPARTVNELVALAKARPAELYYASPGSGSGPHLGFELLKITTRIDVVHVPYRGAASANVDLVAGNVHLMFNSLPAGMSHIRAGRLRVLAVTSAKRSPVMPQLPTLAESGVPGFDVTSWYGLIAPAGVPHAIVAKVQSDAAAALRHPAVHARLAGEGAEAVGSTPEQMGKLIAVEIQKWAKVVREAKIAPESFQRP